MKIANNATRRKGLMLKHKGTHIFWGEWDGKEFPILEAISHASAHMFNDFLCRFLHFDEAEKPPHSKLGIDGECREAERIAREVSWRMESRFLS
jgi:hypothetical protein